MFEAFFPTPTAADLPLSPPPSWPSLVQPAISVTSALIILLPAGPVRLSSGGVVLGLNFYLMFYLYFWTADQTSFERYITATGCIGSVYRWLDLVAIHNPEKDFWRETEVENANGKKHVIVKGHAPEGYWAKLKWFLDLSLCNRGVGWNIRASHMPAPEYIPRTRWVLTKTVRFVFIYLGIDVTSTILMYMTSEIPFFEQPFLWQVTFSWIKAFRTYYLIESTYFFVAIPAVALGISTPSEWPPITGQFREKAYTVRKMWGDCWHQLMRRPCSEAGRIAKELLGLKKGTFASRYTQIWVAFLASAMSHHAGAVVGMFEDGGLWQAMYFMIQPAGIMLEDFAIFVGAKMGLKETVWTKRVGFLWVILWFSWSLRFMVAYQPSSWLSTYMLPSFTGLLLEKLKVKVQ